MTPTTWSRLRKRLTDYEAKGVAEPDEHGFRASENLRHLQKLKAAIDTEIDREIIRARDQGMSWADIGFGTSKQAAQQRHAAAVRRRTPRGQ